MNNKKKYSVGIIGAGIGGLASAALWANQGHDVHVFEAHSSSGGCASYFKRREGHYDVGATTLSGMGKDRPLQKLSDDLELNLETELIPCDPGVIISDKERIALYRNKNDFINEFLKVSADVSDEFDRWERLETCLWKYFRHLKGFPKANLIKLFELTLQNIQDLPLLLEALSKNFYDFLPLHLRENEDFIRCIDEVLLISTQQKSRTCPAFMGVMGLLYPRDTWIHSKGMYGFCKTLETKISELNGSLHFSEKCIEINYKEGMYEIQTKKGSYIFDKIIFNIDPRQILLISNVNFINNIYKKKVKTLGELWGALSFYGQVHFEIEPVGQFYQYHLNKGSLFISLSSDKKRVTISKHVKISKQLKHLYKDKEKYLVYKNEFEKECISALEDIFKCYKIKDIEVDSVGTPKTFSGYVNRTDGAVGGLIHDGLLSLQRLIPNNVFGKEVYHVGDFSFPGQGIVSVIQSAYNTLD